MLLFSRFWDQIFETTTLHTYRPLCVIQQGAIIKSKAKQIFNPPILKIVTTTFFFGWGFCCLED